jgi:hypothetical protein
MPKLNINELLDVRLCKNDVRSNEPPTLIFIFKNENVSENGTFDEEFLNHFSQKEQDEFFEHFEHFCISKKYEKCFLPAYMSLNNWLSKLNLN